VIALETASLCQYWNLLENPGITIVVPVAEAIEVLERRIERLRVGVREAVLAGDSTRARALRAELKEADQAWEAALAEAELNRLSSDPADEQGPDSTKGKPSPAGELPSLGPLLPLREQVYEALSLLQVPAAPRLIATVHEALFATTFSTVRVTSLRRDEERSFRTAPFTRPYYICAALTADFLSPSRALLAVSTWPMERRVIGSLSPRVDFLTAAIRVAEAIERIPAPVPAARRLLWRFAAGIPGAAHSSGSVDPQTVRSAAEAELAVHIDADTRTRHEAAERARRQLSDVEQLFGTKLKPAGRAVGEDA
jgi:hypothetical protein